MAIQAMSADGKRRPAQGRGRHPHSDPTQQTSIATLLTQNLAMEFSSKKPGTVRQHRAADAPDFNPPVNSHHSLPVEKLPHFIQVGPLHGLPGH